MDPPRNRKQRRAATAAASSDDSFDASSIPLAHPKKQPKGKTLLEIAAGRQKGFQGLDKVSAETLLNLESTETQFLEISPSGKVSQFNPSSVVSGSDAIPKRRDDDDDDDASLPPVIDTVLLSLPLTTLHYTLAFLAAHQYAQEIPLRQLARESIMIAFPVLTLCIHLAHGHIVSFGKRSKSKSKKPSIGSGGSSNFWSTFMIPSLRTIVFLPLALYLGGYLIQVTNEDTYYAVMKSAPAIGTLWVWCVLEMSAGAALLAFLMPLGWGVLWKGYAIF